ncbi:MAG: ABC transporter ATP-binding protein [Cyclobacteriaceae bacterium]|nr:ABC transporter ATP-binding protein [Cyclobacteriaceae bacterium]
MKPQQNHSDTAVLLVNNLTVGYKSGSTTNVLLENLKLVLHQGELVCFMGPNGIGKSTLIRTLAGLQPPIAGSILTPSQSTNSKREEIISVVLTDRITALNMTVLELVTYGRYPYLDWNLKLNDHDEAFVEQAIKQTRIETLIEKKLYELSDGQMQMVMVARALAQDTPVVLLDEPTAHLDLNNRVEIMNLLRNLAHDSGKTILVATHELDLALQTADTIWLTGKNKEIITGIPEDLVLNGTFDEIFQFKGFDLKTGKVSHSAWRNTVIALSGDGHAYLWTKNALERNGYVLDENKGLPVSIFSSGEGIVWTFNDTTHTSLQQLLAELSR